MTALLPHGRRGQTVRGILGTLLAAAAAGVAGGCGGSALVDQAPLRNFVVVSIANDLTRSVDVTECFDAACRSHDVVDAIEPGHTRTEAVNNASRGRATFRVTEGAKQLGCLYVPYRSGQEKAAARISNIRSC